MSALQGTLPGFEGVEVVAVPRSSGGRLTARRARLVAKGYHPLNQRKLRPGGGTCGTCFHLKAYSPSGNRTVRKCELGPFTHAASTDVRLRWPACVRWKETDDVAV